MTRSRSSRGRRRNRDRMGETPEGVQQEGAVVTETTPSTPAPRAEAAPAELAPPAAPSRRRRRPERRPPSDERDASSRRPAPEGGERPPRGVRPSGDSSDGGGRGPRPQGEGADRGDRSGRGGRPQAEGQERPGIGGRDRGNRRRQGRRPQAQPMPNEVLKPRVRPSGAVEVLAKRQIAQLEQPDGPKLGCPMLSRTQLGMPFAQGRQVPRCALGWAVHSESEAALCMETPDLTQCWKSHPERVAEIREYLAERAAD